MTQFGRASAVTAAVGLGVLLGGAGLAEATETQNFSVPTSSTTTSTTATFGTFDPGLGTLTEVVVGLSNVVIGGGSSFSITGAEGGSSGTTLFSADLAVTDPSATSLFTGTFGANSGCTTPNPFQFGQSCSAGPVTPTDQVTSPGSFQPTPVDIPAADWSPFIGVASTVALTEAITAFDVGTGSCTLLFQEGSCTPTNNISWSGTLSLTYVYTPNTDIPEPGGWAVLMTGLAGIGWAGRRRLLG